MKIKIEIDSGMISPREYAVRTIAKEIVKLESKKSRSGTTKRQSKPNWKMQR